MSAPVEPLRADRQLPVAAPVVGVLALQGDVSEHVEALVRCGARPAEVRTRAQLDAVDGLVIPGGESTTVGKLLSRFGLLDPLKDRIAAGMPVYGTCTGMILLAREIEEGLAGQPVLDAMHIRVRRNAFGRQRESFEAEVTVHGLGEPRTHGVFLRAPLVTGCGEGVEVLATLDDQVVAVREGHLLATAFHPELSGDDRFHAILVDMCRHYRNSR